MTLLPDAELLELKGYNRVQVATLMQAVDAILMTSFTEGSPQVIKEALACGCPIVSVDVGDVSLSTCVERDGGIAIEDYRIGVCLRIAGGYTPVLRCRPETAVICASSPSISERREACACGRDKEQRFQFHVVLLVAKRDKDDTPRPFRQGKL